MDDPLADLRVVSDLRTRLGSLLSDRPGWLVGLAAGCVAAVLATFVLLQVLAPAPASPETYLPEASSMQWPSTSTVVETGTLTVHVAGAVKQPGLVEADGAMRVGDALALAGGPLARADVDRLNLAEPLVDGVRVYVPRIGEEAVIEPLSTAGDSEAGVPALVNINTADMTALETLPGIGPVTAEAIIAHRTDNGPFSAVGDLESVSGIGPKTMEGMVELVTVGP